jgi:hypothetical protein
MWCSYDGAPAYCSLASNPPLQLGGPGSCVYVPSDSVAQLYSRALGPLSFALYDSESHGTYVDLHRKFNVRKLGLSGLRVVYLPGFGLQFVMAAPAATLLPARHGTRSTVCLPHMAPTCSARLNVEQVGTQRLLNATSRCPNPAVPQMCPPPPPISRAPSTTNSTRPTWLFPFAGKRLSVCPFLSFHLLNDLTDPHETWYERHCHWRLY